MWRLYLAGGSLAFEESRMGVDKVLMVPAGVGNGGLPDLGEWAPGGGERRAEKWAEERAAASGFGAVGGGS